MSEFRSALRRLRRRFFNKGVPRRNANRTLLDRNLVAAVQLQTRCAHAPNLRRMHAVQRPGRSRLAVT